MTKCDFYAYPTLVDSVSLAAESCNMNASNLYDQLSGVKNRVNKTEFRFI